MSSRWQRVWEIFEDLLELPAEEREAALADRVGDDAELRRSVEEMLAADRVKEAPLDLPPGALVPPEPRPTETAPWAERPASGPLAPGSMVGPYRILRQVGQGGMSTVYLAVRADDAFARQVVVKVVRADVASPALEKRLRTERRILASLDHPHVARLYDGGTLGAGAPYFVMEYIEGVAIDTYCERNRLSVDERLTLFRKVCSAVHYAHQNLIVHRDIKPSNILVTAAGEPKLLDFGIAKLLKPDLLSEDSEPTRTLHRALTPSYASPEQIFGKLITTASDVYSLGVLLYKLLTRRLPRRLDGRSLAEIESLLTDSEPLPPSASVTVEIEDASTEEAEALAGGAGAERQGAVPHPAALSRQLAGDLDAIVLKTLRFSPRHRYESVESLAADIERYQSGLPVLARAGNWRYRAGKLLRRNRRAVAAAAVAALLLLGFAAAMALQARRVAYERDQARLERDKKARVLELVLEIFEVANPFVVPGGELTVRGALERGLPVLEQGLRDQPEVRSELLHASGSIFDVLGHYATAEEQLTEAHAIRRQLYGERHPDTIASLSALASATKSLGRLDEARDLAERAVELAEASLGEEHPMTALAIGELISVLCFRSEFGAAEEEARRALSLATVSGDSAGAVGERITVLELLAISRNAQGDYEQAVTFNREAVELRRERYGERHPSLLETLNSLGLSLRRSGKLDAAERTFREALAISEESFGPDLHNPQLLINLAGVKLAQERFAEAEEIYARALSIVREKIGPEHWMVFYLGLRTAVAKIGQGRAAEAEQELRALLPTWQARLGEHWRIREGYSLLGHSISVQGRCEEAEPILIESFEALVGVASDRTRRDALRRLAHHLEACGKPSEIARYEGMLEPAAS